MIHRDGSFVDAEPAVPARAGAGAFTTLGCDGGRPLLWPAHVERLRRTLAVLLSYAAVELPGEECAIDLLGRAGCMGHARGRIVARMVGEPARWSVEMSVEPLTAAGPNLAQLVLAVERWQAAPPLAGHKTLARLAWDHARGRARAGGADDALIVDREGRVLETSVANVFARFGSTLVTPHAGRHCLPGVMRAWVLAHADACGLEAVERDLPFERCMEADEIFVSNAVVGLRRVVGVDERVWAEWPAFDRFRTVGVPAPGWAGDRSVDGVGIGLE